MKIIEKIKNKQKDWYGERQPVIAFLGDSVTHGCFDVYVKNDTLQTTVNMQEGYHEKVKKILAILYPEVPVTVVNAGISGDRADAGVERLERDVLSYKPDLVVVCYGLNDAMKEQEGVELYRKSLARIFSEVKNSGAEVIFMTPNLRTDKRECSRGEVTDSVTDTVIKNETEGWLESYLSAAKEACAEQNVPVCDCNALWKSMKNGGVDMNVILSNKINHPTEELHWLFAYELVRTMFLG